MKLYLRDQTAGVAQMVRVPTVWHTRSLVQVAAILVCVQVCESKKAWLQYWPSRGQQVSHQS